MVVFDFECGIIMVVGDEVKLMFGCIFGNIWVVCFLCDGVIVDFDVVE